MLISTASRTRLWGATLAGVLAASALCGCATAPSNELIQTLDPKTGVTMIKLPAAVAFTGAETGALDARLDAIVGPVAIDTMGTYSYYLYLSAQRYDNMQPGYAPGIRLLDGDKVIFERRPGTSVKPPLSNVPYTDSLSTRSQFYYSVSEAELANLEVPGKLGIALSYDNHQWTRLLSWDGPVVNFNLFLSQVVTR